MRFRALSLLLALIACACWRRATPPAPTDLLAHVRWDDSPIDWSRRLPQTPASGLKQAGYVGALACQPCHKKLFASYARHSMASSGMRPLASLDPRWLAKIFDAGAASLVLQPRSGLRYRPVRKGGRYFIEELLPGDDGRPVHSWSAPVTHLLSAGSYGLAFYVQKGERFYQLPIDYYAKLGRWDLDPGFAAGNARFGHALDTKCISCHSDYPSRSAGSEELFFEPMPAGIGCERCHGPGARHVETLAREDIVNPVHLPPLRQLDACGQCHLDARSQPRAGRDEFSFRPGEPLDAFRVSFLAETPEPDRFDLLAHPDRLVRSACWRRSGKKLTCTTCHDPHVSSRDEPLAWWDDKCMGCHREKPCTAPPVEQASQDGHCPRCHMRAGPTSLVPLVSLTDHFIQRRPPPIKPGHENKAARVVPWATFIGESDAGTDLPALEALALSDEGHDDQALPLAVHALAQRPAVPRLYYWFVRRFEERREPRNALAALAAILRFAPDANDVLVDYARRKLDAGDTGEAMHALDRALALDPGDALALETKGMFLFRAGRTGEARPLFERAAAEGTMAGVAQVGLAALALRDGRNDEAVTHLEEARRISPGDAWVLDKLAARYADAHDRAHADEIERARRYFVAKDGLRLTSATLWLPAGWR